MLFKNVLTVAVAAVSATVVKAQKAFNPLLTPAFGQVVNVPQPLQITWTATSSGNIDLLLREGGATDLSTLLTIASGIENTGSYTWTPPTNLATNTDYSIQIVDSSNSSLSNYSPHFTILSVGQNWTPTSGEVATTASLNTATTAASDVSTTASEDSVSSSASEAASTSASTDSTVATSDSAAATTTAASTESASTSDHAATTSGAASTEASTSGEKSTQSTLSTSATASSTGTATTSAAVPTKTNGAGSLIPGAVFALGATFFGAIL